MNIAWATATTPATTASTVIASSTQMCTVIERPRSSAQHQRAGQRDDQRAGRARRSRMISAGHASAPRLVAVADAPHGDDPPRARPGRPRSSPAAVARGRSPWTGRRRSSPRPPPAARPRRNARPGWRMRNASRSNSRTVSASCRAAAAWRPAGPTSTTRSPSAQRLGAGGARRPRRPAQHRLHPQHQLARRERLGHVVVGAELQAEHPVGLLAERGQHDDRQRPGRAARSRRHTSSPSMPGSIRSSTTRSGGCRVDRGQRRRPVGGQRHLEAGPLQVAAHDVAHGRVVVDDQYALPHGSSLDRTATRTAGLATRQESVRGRAFRRGSQGGRYGGRPTAPASSLARRCRWLYAS